MSGLNPRLLGGNLLSLRIMVYHSEWAELSDGSSGLGFKYLRCIDRHSKLAQKPSQIPWVRERERERVALPIEIYPIWADQWAANKVLMKGFSPSLMK